MEIVGDDYKLEYREGSNKFNLHLLKVVHAKDPEKRREELISWGYDMSLDHCISVIINNRISKNNDSISLKEYVDQYISSVDN
jgi:hypothetical protein